ncbi:unnamed protein product [Rhizophagus irregularis]|nr:unnamed protein product [Rhizophagus irregularis]CAB4418117.1 unnamed protein product [Rhizophagus irregularis]
MAFICFSFGLQSASLNEPDFKGAGLNMKLDFKASGSFGIDELWILASWTSLVGFLNIGHHLVSMFFFVGRYLAVYWLLGMNCFLDPEKIGSDTCNTEHDEGI